MLEWLINIGRGTIVSAAASLIAGFVIGGWCLVAILDHAPWNTISIYRFLMAAAGFYIGSSIAGVTFGLAAAIFDIQRNVRFLAKGGPADDDYTPARIPHLREPTLERKSL